jgi:hypothetical protein
MLDFCGFGELLRIEMHTKKLPEQGPQCAGKAWYHIGLLHFSGARYRKNTVSAMALVINEYSNRCAGFVGHHLSTSKFIFLTVRLFLVQNARGNESSRYQGLFPVR